MNANLRKLPPLRWLIVLSPLIAALFVAPLAYGGVTPETVRIVDGLLVLSGILWIGLLVIKRRLPSLSVIGIVCLSLLVILGVLHLLNPKSIHEAVVWRFLPRAGAIEWLPGSVDRKSSLPVVMHFGALLVGGLVLQDALASSRVRWLLFRVIAFSGLLVAFIGIFQKANGSEAMLWAAPENSGSVFFAAFRYHANAASFLNLCWPAAFAVWLRSHVREPASIRASLDLCVFFFLFAAVFVNTSKAGHALGLIGAILIGWRFRSVLLQRNMSRVGLVVVGFLLVSVFAVLILPGFVSSFDRWNELASGGGSLRGRLLAYGACLKILPDSGFFGTGPGTFRLVFPLYTGYLGDQIQGFWYYAHQDWLQGLIEWGYAGFAAWAVLYAGAFTRLVVRIRAVERDGDPEISSSVSLIALLVVMLHALVDFPLQIPAIQLLVVFYLAVAWRGERRVEPSPVSEAEQFGGTGR